MSAIIIYRTENKKKSPGKVKFTYIGNLTHLLKAKKGKRINSQRKTNMTTLPSVWIWLNQIKAYL
jgi:hypothetical protein